MTLEHGKVIVKKTYKNVYKFHMKFMEGDADGYEYVTLYVSPSNKQIERFIDFLDECDKAYPHGRGGGGRDNYDRKVEDWKVFCGQGEDLTNGDKDLENLVFDWPYDSYCDTDTSFENYVITYFDNEGIEYEVKVKR